MAVASAVGQSFADGEWRRKANGITIVGPAALLADNSGRPQGGKPSGGWCAQRAKSKGKGGKGKGWGKGGRGQNPNPKPADPRSFVVFVMDRGGTPTTQETNALTGWL